MNIATQTFAYVLSFSARSFQRKFSKCRNLQQNRRIKGFTKQYFLINV